jgi:hypothetical protein
MTTVSASTSTFLAVSLRRLELAIDDYPSAG